MDASHLCPNAIGQGPGIFPIGVISDLLLVTFEHELHPDGSQQPEDCRGCQLQPHVGAAQQEEQHDEDQCCRKECDGGCVATDHLYPAAARRALTKSSDSTYAPPVASDTSVN